MKTRKLNVVNVAAAPEPTAEQKLSLLVYWLESKMASASKNLEKFISNFNTNPAYAFGWSKGAFEDAAWQAITAELLQGVRNLKENPEFDDEKIYENIINHAKKTCVQMARYPAQSTSPTSNLMEQYKLAAWATLADPHGFW